MCLHEKETKGICIRKWSLSILKLLELLHQKLPLRKKRFAIGMQKPQKSGEYLNGGCKGCVKKSAYREFQNLDICG